MSTHQSTDLAAAAEPERSFWREGDQLVMHREAHLPDRCVKTNQANVRHFWVNARVTHWSRFAIATLGVVLVFLYSSLAGYGALVLMLGYIGAECKKATIRVGLCSAWKRRRDAAQLFCIWNSLTAALLVIVGTGQPEGGVGIYTMAFGMLFGVATIMLTIATRNIIPAACVKGDYVWLRGVHPEFLAQLPESSSAPAQTA